MTDSHVHLTMFDAKERKAVLRQAQEAGVTQLLVPATGAEDLEEVAHLPQELGEGVFVALGFHPHQASQLDSGWKKKLERLLSLPQVVAVGEIGLDFFYCHSPKEDQLKAFSWQLDLAQAWGLPVVLHQRQAWPDFLATLGSRQPLRGVAHSFTEGASGVRAVQQFGLFVGISGMVTFPKGDNVREAAREAEATMLLVETDAPYLAPAPHRGKTNQPAWVRLVAEAVARERQMTLEELEAQTDENFARLFLHPTPAP
ncbi:MAG: TatD family hydrolase [Thermoanaerobaculum sp.]|nr:TatD family hydrolase [Thermoanaerobaculum sp.]